VVIQAPAAQTGEQAFRRSKESGRLSGAASLAEADAVADEKMVALKAGGGEMRRAGGRMFQEVNGVWTDVNHRGSLHVVTVVPFSKAYFAVARALPEISASLKVGDTLLVAGKKASVKIAAGGRETLSDAEVRELVKAFRGA
jgi:hypothetical protein